MTLGKSTPVAVEVGTKKVFAWVLEWPGWCRAAKTEELALEALTQYGSRYAAVAEEAGLGLPPKVGADFEVVETVPGSATTDFGAPGAITSSDAEPVADEHAQRTAAVLAASWTVLDYLAGAAPAELRKGPRGGGRDRDKIVQHVVSAEAAYARKIGVKHQEPSLHDKAAVAALREAILGVLAAPSDGAAPVPKGWPPRYAARRIAWHVLDHAWEIEDRST